MGRSKRRKSVPHAGKKRATQPGGKVGSERRGWVRRFFYWLSVTAIWAIVAVIGAGGYFALDLPEIGDLGERTARPRVTLLSADGSRLAAFGDQSGDWVDVKDLPKSLIEAVLATEDRRFYSHFGIDPAGLARATLANIRAGRIVQGGSTLTQQLAKNLFLSPARTFRRKARELLLALRLEHDFTKDQILGIYLNRVYLGGGSHGVDGAARRYFNKPVTAINARQAALLAGLLKAPSRYAPTNSRDNARARADQVIANMRDAGYMTAVEAERAGRLPLGLKSSDMAGEGRYFADWVMRDVGAYLGAAAPHGARDIVIRTTLDPRLQELAQKAVSGALDRDGVTLGVTQGALIALTPEGAIRAMVGGRAYRLSQYNRASQARRQPGSAFKLFVYLAAMETGLTPDSVMRDGPVILDGWQPRNYSGRYAGPVTLRRALSKSINTVAVKLTERVDRRRVAAVARRLGITTALTRHPSIALGTSEVRLIELTAAYGALAAGGLAVTPRGVREIRDGRGRVLYRWAADRRARVIAPRQVAQLSDMLAEVLATGTGKAARLDRPAAGKTGTSQDFRDAVFVGYTADLVAGVWVGNDDAAPMRRVTGGGLPARIWRAFMAPASAGLPARALWRPPQEKTAAKKPGFWKRLFSRRGQSPAPQPR